jgi:hypothetical protein
LWIGYLMELIFGQDEAVAEWASSRLGTTLVRPYVAIGVGDASGLHAAMVFNDYTGANIEITVTSDPAGWTRAAVRAAFAYPFRQVGCRRLTLRTRADHTVVLDIAARLGFQREGVLREFYDDGCNAVVFGLLRSECRWIEGCDHEKP